MEWQNNRIFAPETKTVPPMRKLVIIPTYNEKENISAMISKVFSLEEAFEMLVIDDGSPDGTAAIVR